MCWQSDTEGNAKTFKLHLKATRSDWWVFSRGLHGQFLSGLFAVKAGGQ